MNAVCDGLKKKVSGLILTKSNNYFYITNIQETCLACNVGLFLQGRAISDSNSVLRGLGRDKNPSLGVGVGLKEEQGGG